MKTVINVYCLGQIMGGCYSRFVVTARHCTETVSVDRLTVSVGDHNIDQNDGEQILGVRREIPQPDNLDITLLELSQDLVFSPAVRPVCLPTDTSLDYEGVPGTNYTSS